VKQGGTSRPAFFVGHNMLGDFSSPQLVLIGLIFVWTGFVRSGLGFGGAALGLPLMLFIDNHPLFWLPIIGLHLLFFSSLTLTSQLHSVDWAYLRRASAWIIPAALAGVFGLLNLPNQWLLGFIYTVTLVYAFIWLMNWAILSRGAWLDRLFLLLGGYIAGTSLTGAPLMVAVFMRNVIKEMLRNTLFVLWFVLVAIKMTTFAALGVEMNVLAALMLLPVAAVGHVIGLRVHERILRNDRRFKQVMGGFLMVVSAIGLWRL
jgi:uncharacterized membrane protein YfcA